MPYNIIIEAIVNIIYMSGNCPDTLDQIIHVLVFVCAKKNGRLIVTDVLYCQTNQYSKDLVKLSIQTLSLPHTRAIAGEQKVTIGVSNFPRVRRRFKSFCSRVPFSPGTREQKLSKRRRTRGNLLRKMVTSESSLSR